jgi:hypothetical protein
VDSKVSTAPLLLPEINGAIERHRGPGGRDAERVFRDKLSMYGYERLRELIDWRVSEERFWRGLH